MRLRMIKPEEMDRTIARATSKTTRELRSWPKREATLIPFPALLRAVCELERTAYRAGAKPQMTLVRIVAAREKSKAIGLRVIAASGGIVSGGMTATIASSAM